MKKHLLALTILTLLTFPDIATAVQLASVIASSGGNRTVELDGGTLYTGGQYFTESATINGNGATINLAGAGPTNNLGVSGPISLTLNNVILTNGAGVLLFDGSTLSANGVTFSGTQKGVRVDTGCQAHLTNCILTGQTENTLDLSGGTVTLTQVNVQSGPQIVVFGSSHLIWNGGQFLGGGGYGVNVQASDPSSVVELYDVHFQDRTQTAINLTQFALLVVDGCTIQDSIRGIDVQSLGVDVQISNTTIDAFGLPVANRQDGILVNQVQNAVIDNVTITNLRSGIVALNVDTFHLSNSTLTGSHKNQLNTSHVANGMIENCFMRSAPIAGEVNVEDFDVYYTEESTTTIRNSMLLDAADNGVFGLRSNLTVENCFIAGSRTNGLQLHWAFTEPEAPGSHFWVRDSTIINSQHQDIFVTNTSRLDADRVILGNTPTPAFPSNTIWPGNAPQGLGMGLLSQSPRLTLVNALIYHSPVYGIFLHQINSAPIPDFAQIRFSTIAADSSPTGTREGVLFSDVGAAVAFSDNHIYGVPSEGSNRRNWLLTGLAEFNDAQRNRLGAPGEVAIVHAGSGAVTAENNDYGAANGPSGGLPGSGSAVWNWGSGSLDVTPYSTTPTHGSDSGLMSINAAGSGTKALDTGEMVVTITVTGGTAGSALSTISGVTDYRTFSKPLDAPPDDSGTEVRTWLNLWMDQRIHHFRDDSTQVTLAITDKDASPAKTSARLYWMSPNGLEIKNAATVTAAPSGRTATFLFNGTALLPTSTLIVGFSESAPAAPTGWLLTSDEPGKR